LRGLEAILARNSGNSSCPPSSDPPLQVRAAARAAEANWSQAWRTAGA
jgi:hypothetical protein